MLRRGLTAAGALAIALCLAPPSPAQVTSLYGDKDGFGMDAPEVDRTLFFEFWRWSHVYHSWKDYRQVDDLADAPLTDIWEAWYDVPQSWTHSYDLSFTPGYASLHIYCAQWGNCPLAGELYVDGELIRTFWPRDFLGTRVIDTPIPLSYIDGETTFTMTSGWGEAHIFDYMELTVLPEAPGSGDPPGSGGGGDTCETATVIPGIPFTGSGTTCSYTDDYDEVCPFYTPGSPDVAYVYYADSNETVDISLRTNAGYDTKLYVYSGSCEGYPSGTTIGCNDDIPWSIVPTADYEFSSELLDIELNADGVYYIIVDGNGGYCGNYTLEITAHEPPPVECSADALFGQDAALDTWTATPSDEHSQRVCYEYFSGVSGNITTVRWWGTNAICTNGKAFWEGKWWPCWKEDERFEITLYQDDNGQPGAALYGPFVVTPEKIDTGVVLLDAYPLCQYTAMIPSCTLRDGWISIEGIDDGQTCWSCWLSSNEGNGYSRQWDDRYSVWYTLGYDQSVCLSGEYVPSFGACCNDWNGTCEENVEAVDCPSGPYDFHRFLPGGTCGDFDPPCGDPPGACCRADGTCDLVPATDCVGSWLGAGTACSMCPCTVYCPPGSTQESEPCGDDVNGGCNMPRPRFEPITCGTTVCGTAWALNEFRDTDWYRLVVNQDTQLTWTVKADFAVTTCLLDGTAGCDSYTDVQYDIDNTCNPITLTSCVPPGVYWLVVLPYYTDGTPCDGHYVATLSCDPCTVTYGACCSPMGWCTDTTEDECMAYINVAWYEGVACDAEPCAQPPANDTCETAEPLPVPGSVIADNYLANTQDGMPFCHTSSPFHGMWYAVTGTGNTMTASTCSPNTTFDTQIQVFGDCNGWSCVGGNDDTWSCDVATQDTIVSWCSVAGYDYYIHIGSYHYYADTAHEDLGTFELTVTDDGVPCDMPPGACCRHDGQCMADQTEMDCGLSDGVWQGAGTTCDPSPCERFYCEASGGCDEYVEYIVLVWVGDIFSWGKCDQYADRTEMFTEMEVGASYPITVRNIDSHYYHDQCGIWVDWNQDGEFDGPGETIEVAGSPGPGPDYTALITPPAWVSAGATRLRVRLMRSGTLSPCGTSPLGEVEDYTIVLVAPPGCPGDSNCDGGVSWRDIDFFVAAMNDNLAAWRALFPSGPTCPFANNDVNDDGTVSWRDIDPFVALMNTTCP